MCHGPAKQIYHHNWSWDCLSWPLTNAPTLCGLLHTQICSEAIQTHVQNLCKRVLSVLHWHAAGRLISEMQAGVDAHTAPRTVSASQATRLHQILHEAKFADPSGSHLSPAGMATFTSVLSIQPDA